MDSFGEPNAETKYVEVELAFISQWRDDRVRQIIPAAETEFTVSDWVDLGIWSPEIIVINEVEGQTMSDTIQVARKDLGHGQIEISCTRVTVRNSVIRWLELNWYYFPFGKQEIDIRINCGLDALCSCHDCNYTDPGSQRRSTNRAPQDAQCVSDRLKGQHLRKTTGKATAVSSASGSTTGLATTTAIPVLGTLDSESGGALTVDARNFWPSDTFPS